MNKLLSFLAVAFVCSGCFWPIRVPVPMEQKYSDAGECTNFVWKSLLTDLESRNQGMTRWNIYPLISLRVDATHHIGEDDDIPIDKLNEAFPDRKYTGEDLYDIKWQRKFRWLHYGLLWIGSPVDAVVDTFFLPYDLMKE